MGYNWLPPLVSFLIRLIFALILVYSSYNPSGYSLFHWHDWVRDTIWRTEEFHFARIAIPRYRFGPITIPSVIFCIVWYHYAKISLRSFGGILLSLLALFFSIFTFCTVGLELFGKVSTTTAYLLLFLLGMIFATSMYWSHASSKIEGW